MKKKAQNDDGTKNHETKKQFYINVLCIPTDRQMDNIYIEQKYIDQLNLQKKNHASIVKVTQKLTFYILPLVA